MSREQLRCPTTEHLVGWHKATGVLVHADADDYSPCFGEAGHILQIIPAPGWRATYAGEEDGKVVVWEDPVMAFGLVEYCDGGRDVVPFGWTDDIGERCDLVSNFIGLLSPAEQVDDGLRKKAEEHVRKKHEREPRRPSSEGGQAI